VAICPNNCITLINGSIYTDRNNCRVCGECEAVCPSGARRIVGKEMTLKQVLDEVRKDRPFYERSNGGITLGGGEPTMWTDFAYNLLWQCLQEGIDTTIETCGYASWKNLKLLSSVTNLFFYDLKCMDDKKHKKYTGVSNNLILQNLIKLSNLKRDIIVRIPIIPNVNDSKDNIDKTARFVKKLNNVRGIELLPYHRLGVTKYNNLGRTYKLADSLPPTDDKLDSLNAIVSSHGIKCISEDH
jgi:pyruvate formate lyase activating enzyme